MVKSPPAVQETQVQSLGREGPWGRKWQPTPVFLPGEFHRQRSLEGYSPWGCIESARLNNKHTHTRKQKDTSDLEDSIREITQSEQEKEKKGTI